MKFSRQALLAVLYGYGILKNDTVDAQPPLRTELPYINEIYSSSADPSQRRVEVAVAKDDNAVYYINVYAGTPVTGCTVKTYASNAGSPVVTISEADANNIVYVTFETPGLPAINGMIEFSDNCNYEALSYGNDAQTCYPNTFLNIGVTESGTDPSCFSLQRQLGSPPSWNGPRVNTLGAANNPTSTVCPTKAPTKSPTAAPVTSTPTAAPVTSTPTAAPLTSTPTRSPTKMPTKMPTQAPTKMPTKMPTQVPTKMPTTSTPTAAPVTSTPTAAPTKAPISCDVVYQLFNSQTEQFVANVLNGTTLTTPPLPPCKRTNIEAIVPCGDTDNRVVIELFSGGKRIRSQVESIAPYFLFGNSGTNVFDGKIAPGTYRIRTRVNNVFTPFTTFTLQGPRCA